MAMISAFTTVDKTAHNSRKFTFTLSPTNYGYWKTMIEPFLITKNLMGYVDGSIPCPSKTLSVIDGATVPMENPNYPIWVSNDAHVRMLIISTISEASFRHVQVTTSRDLWLSLEKAYAPHFTFREYTLKTQLLRIEMHGDETPDAYLNRVQEYADALFAIGEPVKDKDLVMLVVSGLREEYYGLKTTITARQSSTAFSELHALFSDHDYMLGKTRAPAPSITSSFAANYAVGSPSMPEARQAQISELIAQLSALRFQVSPIAPSGPQAFYDVRPSNNNRNNNNNNRDTGTNSHVTLDLEAMDNSEAYYGDDALYVGNGKGLLILHIGSSKVYSPQKTFSLKNILRVPEIFHNLLSVPYNPSANHATVLPTTITKPTSFTVANNSPEWPRAMKEEYDALTKKTWSLVPRASNTNVVDGKWVYWLKRDKNGAITRYKARFVAKGFRQQPGNNKGTIDNIICQLGSAFALKDLGPLNYFLGIEIVSHVFGILLS
nr:putative ribonuclease H-like domain-containing protein [Tanacetum cinerariifolium]